MVVTKIYGLLSLLLLNVCPAFLLMAYSGYRIIEMDKMGMAAFYIVLQPFLMIMAFYYNRQASENKRFNDFAIATHLLLYVGAICYFIYVTATT
jgi:hypothetical protein